MAGSLAERYGSLLERIDAAAVRSGRRANDIRLMAVTKTHPMERIREAYEAGIRLFGENRVQEAETKWGSGADLVSCPDGASGPARHAFPDCELQLIGPLQGNKTARAVGLFDVVQSIDRLETIKRLALAAVRSDKRFPVLVEFNTSGEATKSGFPGFEEALPALELLAASPSLAWEGLMTIAPFTDDDSAIRRSFAAVRALRERLEARFVPHRLPVLSMGMSDDFEAAILEGSTLVRIGTALFGRREA